MGIVIPFHRHSLPAKGMSRRGGVASGSTKPKSLRKSGLSRLNGKGPDRAQTYFAGMEPFTTQQLNVWEETPTTPARAARLSLGRRGLLPLASRTSATVIAITSYTSRPRNLSRQPNVRNKVICTIRELRYSKNMANRLAPKKGRPYAVIGERLERIQILMGCGDEGGGAQMARALRLTEGQWSVFRSGTREIKLMYARRLRDLCREYLDGVTLDWIYDGDGPSPRPIQMALPDLRKGA